MIDPRRHSDNCDWHVDQYPWECVCGAIENPDQFKPQWLKAAAGQIAANEAKRK